MLGAAIATAMAINTSMIAYSTVVTPFSRRRFRLFCCCRMGKEFMTNALLMPFSLAFKNLNLTLLQRLI
jgi:hypothetical protein